MRNSNGKLDQHSIWGAGDSYHGRPDRQVSQELVSGG